MKAPLLGIFGNDDRSPDPAEVARTEAALQKFGKPYEFHGFDGAGHGFFAWNHVSYRQQQAVDGWEKVWEFFGKNLQKA
jgi:carboxymethylenebutenolidase